MKFTKTALATVFVSTGVNAASSFKSATAALALLLVGVKGDDNTPIGSVKIVGSDAGFCELIADAGIANTTVGCDASFVLHAAKYADETVNGKLVDVVAFGVDSTYLKAGDVTCLKFFDVADGDNAGSYAP